MKIFNEICDPIYSELNKKHSGFVNEVQKLYRIDDKTLANEQLTMLYSYLKEITPHVLKEDDGFKIYSAMTNLILKAEEDVFGSQIIDINPNFIYNPLHKLDHNLDHYSSPEELLDELVYSTRKRLVRSWGIINDLDTMNLGDKCRLASSTFYKKAKSLGLDVKRIILHPGYSKDDKLYDGNGFHYFNLIRIEEELYLVDCSYAQFFYRGKNDLERLGLYNFSGCYPGIYMIQSEERRKVAEKILRCGWIEATEDNIKDYLDGFTLMYRNGLYYEDKGIADYEVDYSYDDYMNFLYGDDNQVKHEGKEFLGFQKRLLQDPRFIFKK